MAKSERKQAGERDVALEKLAAMFKALGDPTRLRIFEFLRANSGPVALSKKGGVRPLTETLESETDDGITVGEVGLHVIGGAKDPSTISHHLKELRQAALISMERRGKHMICVLHPDALATLTGFVGSLAPAPAKTLPVAARRRRVKETEIQGMSEEEFTAQPAAEPEPTNPVMTEMENSATTRKKKRKE